MGRSKSRRVKPGPAVVSYDSDDERAYDKEEQPDATSSEYFHDEVDDFHAGREKILLDSGRDIMPAGSSSEEEDVLGVDDDDDDDTADVEMYKAQLSRLRNQGIKEDMGSDLEDDDDGLPDDKAWGGRKSKFYGADVSDEDDVDFSGSEPDTALMEEREALNIQRKMAEQLRDEDFGLDIFKDVKSSKPETAEEEKITKDLSKLTKKERLQLVKKESPELIEMIEDFKLKLTEVKDRLLPMWKLLNSGQLPASSGAEYVRTKLRLYLNYCVNVSFYTMLKARRVPVHSHPIIGRLVQYRNLIKQLMSADGRIEREIDAVLQRMKKGQDVHIPSDTNKQHKIIRPSLHKKDLSSAKNASQLVDEDEEKEAHVSKKARKVRKETRFETRDEKEALEYYKMMKAGRKRKAEEEGESGEEGESEEEGAAETKEGNVGDEDMEETEEKRGITYQISKNKGLTPKRKKENRNPRVKNRMKYRKAQIRRKGQVRPYRPELQRYGGEASGIKAGVVKSTKFK